MKKYSIEVISTIVLGLYFFCLAPIRLIARDEGFYTMAARLIAEGKTPYLDFFYPQTPLLPYLYAIAPGWMGARYISALLAVLVGLIMINYCKRKFGVLLAVVALLLYASSNYVIAWYTVSQTYVLSVFFLLLCFVFCDSKKVILAGICYALAIQTRLFFAGLLPIFLLQIYYNKASVKNFLFSLLAGLSPSIALALTNFEEFYFNNLGYHLDRNDNETSKVIGNKLRVTKVALGLVESVKFTAWQLPLLLYSGLLGSILYFIKKRRVNFAFLVLLGLFAINLTPSPTYVQYFSTLIPFGIISSLYLFQIQKKWVFLPLICAFLSIYFYKINVDYLRYTKTGQGVIGIGNPENAGHWNIESILKINAEVSKHCSTNKTILTYWPGYVLESNCRPYPGTENHFGFLAAGRIDQEQAERYKIISRPNTKQAIQTKKPDLILIGKQDLRKRGLQTNIKEAGYEIIYEANSARLLRRSKVK